MTDLPPRSLDDEIKYQVDTVRRDLTAAFENKLREQVEVYDAAAESYRKKLLWFTSGIGALAVSLGVTWTNNQIETRVQDRVTEAVQGIEQRLTERAEVSFREQRLANDERIRSRIETTLGRELAVLEGRLEEERTITTLLPLLVGEVIDIEDDMEGGVERNYDATRIILEALEVIGPEVQQLDGFAFDLAARRIERMLDTFWTNGQLHELHRAFNTLPSDLQERLLSHESEGVLYTMTHALADAVLRDGALPASRLPNYQQVIMQTPDPDGFSYENLAILRLVVLASEVGWDAPEIRTAFTLEQSRWDGFRDYAFETLFCVVLVEHLDAGGTLSAPVLTRLNAIAAAAEQGPIQEICREG
jgi:hypothetical protein